MVVLKIDNKGINRIRDLLATELTYGKLGTDNTVLHETDTGLVKPIEATKLSLTYTTFDGGVIHSYTLNNATGLNQIYKEFALIDANSNDFCRILFSNYEHNNTKELTIKMRTFIENG